MCTVCRNLLTVNVTADPAIQWRQPRLGRRELEVVVAWLIHETKQAAARELHIELSTVKTTIQRARQKYEEAGRPATTQVALLVRLMQDRRIDVAVLLALDRVA